jgi:hypothetical protein
MGRLCSTTQLCGPAVSWINVSFDFLAVDYVSLCSSLACALALQPVVRSPRPPCNPCTAPPLHAARSTLPLWIDIKSRVLTALNVLQQIASAHYTMPFFARARAKCARPLGLHCRCLCHSLTHTHTSPPAVVMHYGSTPLRVACAANR